MKFQVPATITKITTMGDNSLRLQVDVDKELSPNENGQVFSQYNKVGYFLFKESDIIEEDLLDIPEERPEFKDQKTSSQILRNRLFVYYKHSFGKDEGFEDWRKKEMLKIGQHYLNKIND